MYYETPEIYISKKEDRIIITIKGGVEVFFDNNGYENDCDYFHNGDDHKIEITYQ